MKMDILEEAKNVPHEEEREWIERVKDEDHDINNHFEWDKEFLNPLRKLCKKAEKKFAEHIPEHVEFFSSDIEGISPSVIGENMGIEVKSRGDWKRLRREVPDKQLYDYVLYEGIAVHLIFYQRYLGMADMDLDEFADEVVDSTQSCTKEAAKTYKWLSEKEIPEELNVQQGKLDGF